MESTELRALSEIIGKEVEPIPYEEALPLFIQILEEVSIAKREGVILRALNPGNILITSENKIKFSDFIDPKSTGQTQRPKGGAKRQKLFYHSPEKARGEKIDDLSNIYSLGIILYEMLAGRLPFEKDETVSDFTLMNKIAREKIIDPRKFNPDIPEWLVEIIEKATAKEKSERINNAETFSSLLKTGKEIYEKQLREKLENEKLLKEEKEAADKKAQEKLIIIKPQKKADEILSPGRPRTDNAIPIENEPKQRKPKKKKIAWVLFWGLVMVLGSLYFLTYYKYQTVEYEWLVQNLNEELYRNGDTIPEVKDPKDWEKLKTGAWCYYDNEPKNGRKYGKLYNWYAVNDPRGIVPKGWRIPTQKEFEALIKEVNNDSEILRKMTGRSNNINKGFSLLLAGGRDTSGYFYDLDYVPYFWSSTEYDSINATHMVLPYHESNISVSHKNKGYGFSVRCLREKKKQSFLHSELVKKVSEKVNQLFKDLKH